MYLGNSQIQTGMASWGVSHTRVPTESRPGHVALIGGLYEDPSAVTRGWSANPVAFDSVFNQSSHTFSFGSPDILPMFKDGALYPERVDAWSYGDEEEDFSKDAVGLDLWVLARVKELLANATRDGELDKTLRADGTVFFLHLLGLDTTGHSYRPHGPEYHRNIRVVDYVVEETVRALEKFYGGDGRTAFVFTADHGMSSKGNHGDGELDNTRTPLVAWGAGISGGGISAGHDEYSEGWGLEGARRDVEQADVAVLMVRLFASRSSSTPWADFLVAVHSDRTPYTRQLCGSSAPRLPRCFRVFQGAGCLRQCEANPRRVHREEWYVNFLAGIKLASYPNYFLGRYERGPRRLLQAVPRAGRQPRDGHEERRHAL